MHKSRNFFVDHVTGSISSELFSYLCVSQGYIQNFERDPKNSICIGVNNFGKSVKILNFTGVFTQKN